MGNFGYGKHALALTFIYPSLYNRMKKHTKPPAMLRYSDALIIRICLLLSGDIHPCPGPLHVGPEIEASIPADATCNTAVSQVRTGEKLPFDHVQQTNLPHCPRLFCAVGTVLPARTGGAGVVVAVAGLTGASRTRHAVGGLSAPGERLAAGVEAGSAAALSAGPCVAADSESEGDGTLAKPQNIPTIVDFGSSNPCAVTSHKINRKLVNPTHSKNRKWDVFRTVNHSKIVWDPKAKPKGLLGGHLNIRSIKSKSEQVHHLLLDSNLDFLCLSETWLHENTPSAALKVPGFNFYRRDRVGSKGGGVMIYVKDRIQCNEIHWSNCEELECIGLNIILSPQMSFTLIVIYRPPSSNTSFYEKFEKLLKECNFNKEVIIMGDFNINWGEKSSRKNLKQITDKFDLMQLINWPTRITNSTSTQIDLIFSNRP